MNKHFLISTGLIALISVAYPAHADTTYSNNFDTENGGVTALRYDGFSGLTVSYPSVDLLHTGDGNGVSCAGENGGCVDLDGGTPGQLISNLYSFDAGDQLTLSFSFSGSQREASSMDSILYAMRFSQSTEGHFDFSDSTGYHYSDDFGATVPNAFDPTTYDVEFGANAAFDAHFRDATFAFTPTSAGSFRFLFDGYDGSNGDGAGIILDNVALDISAVPEPSTWAMAIVGFGLIGAVTRRRRRDRINAVAPA